VRTQKPTRNAKPSETPELEERRERLQRLYNQKSELEDRIWFNEWNVMNYEKFQKTAQRMFKDGTTPDILVPSLEQLSEKVWELRQQLATLKTQMWEIERDMRRGDKATSDKREIGSSWDEPS